MRKFAVIPMAGLLVLAIAAPAAAGGPNVSNQSGSLKVVNGEWYGEASSGYTYFVTDSSYGAYGEFYEESGEWIPCDEAGESYGFTGTRTYGWAGDLQIELDSRLDHASVNGTLELYTETVDECAGSYGDGASSSVSFSASLDGVGEAASFRNSGSYKVPGDFNSHSKQSGKERQATGSIDLGDAGIRQFDWGMLATVKWSDHSNN